MTTPTILGPEHPNSDQFGCILKLPTQDGMVAVVLRDAEWSHRGRWHLGGLLHCLPSDMWLLGSSQMAEIIYEDKSSEEVHWHLVKADPVHQVSVAHGRFGAYIQGRPRYPRGRSAERLAGIEVTANTAPAIHKILNDYLPGLVDQQRRAWMVTAIQTFRDREVAGAVRKLARMVADSEDGRADLRRLVAAEVDVWSHGDDDDSVARMLNRIERLLELDEKGLPLE